MLRPGLVHRGLPQQHLRLETYIEDAEAAGDIEVADFFRRAQHESRKGAQDGKALLLARLGA